MNLHLLENSAARAPSGAVTARTATSSCVNALTSGDVTNGNGGAADAPAPSEEPSERSSRVIHQGDDCGRGNSAARMLPRDIHPEGGSRGGRCEQTEAQARGAGAGLCGDVALSEAFLGDLPRGGAGQGGDGDDSDEQLVLRVQFGDEEALALLRARYHGLLQSQALRFLRSPEEADDVLSEVFIEVWQRASCYHQEWARAVAWLVTLVRRRAIDRLRVRQRQRKIEVGLSQKQLSCAPDAGSPVEEEMRLGEIRAVLESALNRLPKEQGRVVWMAYYKGFSQKEISKITKAPVGTVKTRLEIGLRKMRQRLSREESILNALRGTGAGRSFARGEGTPEGRLVAEE